MKRGELYRVYRGTRQDLKDHRVFLIVSRQGLVDNNQFSSVICAPVYSKYHGISTQVEVGINEGLKYDSAIHCDDLASLPKSRLTDYIGALSNEKMELVNTALRIALATG